MSVAGYGNSRMHAAARLPILDGGGWGKMNQLIFGVAANRVYWH